MANPIGPGPVGGGSNVPSEGGSNIIPPGPPLPADDVWVKNLAKLFPNVPLGEIMMYAAKFRDNMFQALNNEVQKDLKKAREAARKFKDIIEGRE